MVNSKHKGIYWRTLFFGTLVVMKFEPITSCILPKPLTTRPLLVAFYWRALWSSEKRKLQGSTFKVTILEDISNELAVIIGESYGVNRLKV